MKTPDHMPLEASVDAFVDGELDLADQLEFERRLRDDPVLAARVEGLQQLKSAIRGSADYHVAPADLRARLSPARDPVGPTSRQPDGVTIGERLSAWWGWKGWATAMSAVAVLAIAVNVVMLRDADIDRLSDDVVASHVRSTVGEHLVDVTSSDHHTVKPYLSAKLGFSPPVAELGVPGSTLIGGRVDYLDGRPVAALVYHQGLHTVNSFVWPSKAADSPPSFSADRGFLIAHWTEDGMAHWVISDVNRDEFRSVVLAIQAQDARH